MNDHLTERGIPDQLAEDALLCGVSHDELCRYVDHLCQAISEAKDRSAPNCMTVLQRIGATQTQGMDMEDPASIIAGFYELAGIIPRIKHWYSKRIIACMFFGDEGYLLIPLFEHISEEPSDGERGSIPREGNRPICEIACGEEKAAAGEKG